MVCWRPRFFGVWNSGTALKKIIGPWKLWQPTVWNSLFNNFFGGKLLVFRSVSPCTSDSTPHRRLMLGIIQGLLGELFVTLGDVTWILNDLCMFLVWGGDPPALEGTRHWWVQLWGGPSKSRASGAPNGFWSETENPTVKVGYPKGLWFIELDAGYPESNEDRWIKEMFDVIVHMSSVRSIETKYSIHMYNSTKTHVQSQCLNTFLERTLRSRFREKKLIGHKKIQYRGSTYGMQNAMELWHLCLIVATHETSSAMRKASLNFAPGKKWHSKYERNRLKSHVQCASDPSMIRPWPQEWTGQSAARQLKLFCVLSRRTF